MDDTNPKRPPSSSGQPPSRPSLMGHTSTAVPALSRLASSVVHHPILALQRASCSAQPPYPASASEAQSMRYSCGVVGLLGKVYLGPNQVRHPSTERAPPLAVP
jgi:hypothetical protein